MRACSPRIWDEGEEKNIRKDLALRIAGKKTPIHAYSPCGKRGDVPPRGGERDQDYLDAPIFKQGKKEKKRGRDLHRRPLSLSKKIKGAAMTRGQVKNPLKRTGKEKARIGASFSSRGRMRKKNSILTKRTSSSHKTENSSGSGGRRAASIRVGRGERDSSFRYSSRSRRSKRDDGLVADSSRPYQWRGGAHNERRP